MITIGQFAKDNSITVKTLHHYEKLELLIPLKVDPNTGYRYYGNESQRDLEIILFLKDLGFSLSEVKKAMHGYTSNDIFELLMYKIEHLTNDSDAIESRIFKIQNILSSLQLQKTNIDWKEIVKMSKERTETGNYGKGKLIESRNKAYQQAKDNNTPFTVVAIDLDYFQKVNEMYGYDVGDTVLDRTYSEISAFMKEFKEDATLENRSGDEYHLTFKKKPMEVSLLMSRLLTNIVEVDYSDVAEKLKVTATAGIVGLQKKHNSYSDLIQEALIKLYQNKTSKR